MHPAIRPPADRNHIKAAPELATMRVPTPSEKRYLRPVPPSRTRRMTINQPRDTRPSPHHVSRFAQGVVRPSATLWTRHTTRQPDSFIRGFSGPASSALIRRAEITRDEGAASGDRLAPAISSAPARGPDPRPECPHPSNRVTTPRPVFHCDLPLTCPVTFPSGVR